MAAKSERWMGCNPCETMWRGETTPCFNCTHGGVHSNGPILRGQGVYTFNPEA